MPKVEFSDNDRGSYIFHCPGCKHAHAFFTKGTMVWSFNGDVEKPTFSPSLLNGVNDPDRRCHLFMRDGQIQFLSDCHHLLAGHTVACPEWD